MNWVKLAHELSWTYMNKITQVEIFRRYQRDIKRIFHDFVEFIKDGEAS